MIALKLLVVLFAVIGSTFAQEVADSFAIPVPICGPVFDFDSESVVSRLNRGSLSVATEEARAASASDSLTLVPPTLKCEDGPKRIIHTVPNEFHWPPIWRGSCDKLDCTTPECLVRASVWQSACVHVFKIVHGHWVYAGRQIRRYLSHTKCSCKECEDIRTERECRATKPCPNGDTKDSLCYWTRFVFPISPPILTAAAAEPAAEAIALPGRCRCCKRFPCPRPKIFSDATCSCVCPKIRCPPGEVFNPETCGCDCPPGSRRHHDKRCIGVCEEIATAYCSHTVCEDNDHFTCKLKDYKCVCPSCEEASPEQCQQTKCQEQPKKNICYLEPYSNKCRCPTCADQPCRDSCARTFCGPNNHLQCRWNPFYRNCDCPH